MGIERRRRANQRTFENLIHLQVALNARVIKYRRTTIATRFYWVRERPFQAPLPEDIFYKAFIFAWWLHQVLARKQEFGHEHHVQDAQGDLVRSFVRF